MAWPDNGRTATIYDVAERAGVSIATVSRALQTPEAVSQRYRDKVFVAISEMDYVPDASARSLAARRQEAHGLILPELTGVYYADLVTGYESVAGELDQSLVVVLARGKDDLERTARRLATRVDAMAIMGSAGLPHALVTRLARTLPVVVVAGTPHDGVEVYRTESTTTAADLTGRLLDAGRKQLAFVGDPEAAVDVKDRYAGFVAAHEARGIQHRPVLVADLTEAGGAALAARTLAGREVPDGLVCANDLIAIALVDRLQAAGLDVPGDVAVTGWDDVMAAKYLTPRLTTVRQPVRELAALVACRLHDRVAGRVADSDWGATHEIPTELVIRESCGTAQPTHQEVSSP
ncbi:MAG: LacI family DNA-binding transcriptional regulator [Nostocoides sp.]